MEDSPVQYVVSLFLAAKRRWDAFWFKQRTGFLRFDLDDKSPEPQYYDSILHQYTMSYGRHLYFPDGVFVEFKTDMPDPIIAIAYNFWNHKRIKIKHEKFIHSDFYRNRLHHVFYYNSYAFSYHLDHTQAFIYAADSADLIWSSVENTNQNVMTIQLAGAHLDFNNDHHVECFIKFIKATRRYSIYYDYWCWGVLTFAYSFLPRVYSRLLEVPDTIFNYCAVSVLSAGALVCVWHVKTPLAPISLFRKLHEEVSA